MQGAVSIEAEAAEEVSSTFLNTFQTRVHVRLGLQRSYNPHACLNPLSTKL